jgi:hypothetical protein
LIPALSITRAYLLVSVAIRAAKSSGLPGIACAPGASSRVSSARSRSAALVAAFSVSILSRPVALGAQSPNHEPASAARLQPREAHRVAQEGAPCL